MFFGRRQRTALPALDDAYDTIDTRAVQKARELRKMSSDGREAKAETAEPDLETGQEVFVQNQESKKWDQRGVVIQPTDTNRSYKVMLQNSRAITRDRTFLRPVPKTASQHIPSGETLTQQPQEEDTDAAGHQQGHHEATDAAIQLDAADTKGSQSPPGPRRSSRNRKPTIRFNI